jgi:transposase-like protein
MELKERIKTDKPYRMRRFRCDLCDHEETVFANGSRDYESEPRKALKDINDMYRQEEDNNDFNTL